MDSLDLIAPAVASLASGAFYLAWHSFKSDQARHEREATRLRDKVNNHETRITKAEAKLEMLEKD